MAARFALRPLRAGSLLASTGAASAVPASASGSQSARRLFALALASAQQRTARQLGGESFITKVNSLLKYVRTEAPG